MEQAPAGLTKKMEEAKTSMEEIVANLSAVKGEHYAVAVRDLFSLINGVGFLLHIFASSQGEMNEAQKQSHAFIQEKLISACYENMLYVASAISITDCVVATKNEPFQRAVAEMMPTVASKKTEELKADIDMLMGKMAEYQGMFIL